MENIKLQKGYLVSYEKIKMGLFFHIDFYEYGSTKTQYFFKENGDDYFIRVDNSERVATTKSEATKALTVLKDDQRSWYKQQVKYYQEQLDKL